MNTPLSALFEKALRWIFALVVAGGLIAGFLAWRSAHLSAMVTDCKQRLKQMDVGRALYVEKYKAEPPTLRHIYTPGPLGTPGLFICPANVGKPNLEEELPWEQFESQVGYIYRRPPARKADEPAHRYVILYDKEPHRDGSRCVLYENCVIEKLTGPEFEAALKNE